MATVGDESHVVLVAKRHFHHQDRVAHVPSDSHQCIVVLANKLLELEVTHGESRELAEVQPHWPDVQRKGAQQAHHVGQFPVLGKYCVKIGVGVCLAKGLVPVEGGMTVHMSCPSRAQNMGQKAAEMLRLIPDNDLAVIERCSGHGGSWGIMKDNFETGIKVGKPVARTAARNAKKYVASECPLAGMHVLQGMERLGDEAKEGETKQAVPDRAPHPIELFAQAYGLSV